MPVERSHIDDDSREDDDNRGEDSGSDSLLKEQSVQFAQSHKFLVLPEVATFLYFLALITQSPLTQFWLFDHFSREYNWVKGNESGFCSNSSQTNSSTDLEEEVQSQTNNYVMYTSFISNFVAIFPTVFLGPLTDKFGRKFVFYVCFAGLLGNQLNSIFVFHYDLKPAFLFIGNFLQGLSGSYGLFLAAAFGMIADITSAGKQRAFRVATLEATIAIATSVATITSGIWVKESGYIWPMACSMGEIVLATVFILFFTPETFVGRLYHPFSCKTLLKSFEFYVKDTANKRRFRLIACLVCLLIMLGALIGEANFFLIYLLHQPFCWLKMQITVFSGVVILLKWIAVMSFILVGKRCISEPVFALIGSVSAMSYYLLRGLAKSDLLIFVASGTSLLSELVSPMCRTMMSEAVSYQEQGALFAGIGILQMIMSAVAGVVMSNIYNVGLQVYLGLPYLVLAGFVSLNFVLLIALMIHGRRYPAEEQPVGVDERMIQ